MIFFFLEERVMFYAANISGGTFHFAWEISRIRYIFMFDVKKCVSLRYLPTYLLFSFYTFLCDWMTDTVGKYWNKCSDTFQDTSVFPICYRIFFLFFIWFLCEVFFNNSSKNVVLKREILTVWKGKFWQFEKGNFDS
jgi:hypothetical protein